MIIRIDNAADERLHAFRWRDRQLASSTDRREKVGAGLFIAEGDLVVDRALAAHCIPSALLCDEVKASHYHALLSNVTIYVANEDVRRDVTGLGVPLRAMALFHRPPLTSVSSLVASSSRLVIAEDIDNPTNLGAIIRSAAALGWDGVILSSGSADPLARRALRVSMGTGLMVPFARLDQNENIHHILREHSFVSFALTPRETGLDMRTLDISSHQKIAVYLGSERDGLTSTTLHTADEMVRIPMHSAVDSLNVGAAAAIALYELGPR